MDAAYESKTLQFERLALAHATRLYLAAQRFARHSGDAEDLVQETFLKAYVAWDQFDPQRGCGGGWLMRIMTNSFINKRRKAQTERQWVERTAPDTLPARRRASHDPEGALIEQSVGDEVARALAELPPEFRQVVELADIRGFSYKEVAARLGCPLGTVMSRLHRARRQLGTALGEYARSQGIF